jgi:CheY-like chemotaxis protein
VRILLVDDNPMNVELFVDVLESDGHDIVVERDGEAGRDRAIGERFDVMIVDVQLPKLDGIALCREVRAAGVRTPILAVSSAAMPEQVERGLASGFDEYLTKPISPAALRDAVRRWAGSGRGK